MTFFTSSDRLLKTLFHRHIINQSALKNRRFIIIKQMIDVGTVSKAYYMLGNSHHKLIDQKNPVSVGAAFLSYDDSLFSENEVINFSLF